MTLKIAVQFHKWPWSVGIREETTGLTSGTNTVEFYGSPVASISNEASLFLPQRNERFIPLGHEFDSGGKCRLYEVPHAILSQFRSFDRSIRGREIEIHTGYEAQNVYLQTEGAISRYDNQEKETPLVRLVLSWSQFFDNLIKTSMDKERTGTVKWAEIVDEIDKNANEASEPRMALIVKIAQEMRASLERIVHSARRILLRDRRLSYAGRVKEMDVTCLRWLIRQPGETIAEMAAANRFRLLGVTPRETFDTLENRVLKDFLIRCAQEGIRYWNAEVGENFAGSRRATEVKGFSSLCRDLAGAAHLAEVSRPPVTPHPNYVLQNDPRYREVWKAYIRLLRREDEEDCLWDWQSRTWADMARLLVNVSVLGLACKTSKNEALPFFVRELGFSLVHLLEEQRLGCRILPGSEPGPFLVWRSGTQPTAGSILEIVHPDQAGRHETTQILGRVGGHLYLVLTPLCRSQRRTVVIVWAIHTAASSVVPSWDEISMSVGRALNNHSRRIDEFRNPDTPILRAFVMASDMRIKDAELCTGEAHDVHIVRVAPDQRCWKNALAGVEAMIEDNIEKSL